MTTQPKTNPATLSPDATGDTHCNVCEQLNDEHEWRIVLEGIYGEVWDRSELKRDFVVIRFLAPQVSVRRKDNQEEGTLEFLHHPRLYYWYRSNKRN